MAIHIQQYTDDLSLTIHNDAPLQSRLIAGSGLALMASFFLYYFVTGLIEYVRFATAQEWLANLPGFILNLLLVLVFAAPTWLILLGQAFVVIDEGQGEVTAVRDWRFYQQKQTFQLADVTTITITEQVKSGKHYTHISYPVHLQLANGKIVLLQTADTDQNAHTFARQLARRLQVPVHEQYHLAP